MAKLKVGDAMWWRGMRMEIFAVNEKRGVFRYASVDAEVEDPNWVSRDGETTGRTLPAYVCASAVAEAKWDPDLAFWFMPGVQGEIPKAHIKGDGTVEILDPEPPTCTCDNPLHSATILPEKTPGAHEATCGVITWRAGPLCSNCRLIDEGAA